MGIGLTRHRPWRDRAVVEAIALDARIALAECAAELGELRTLKHAETWDAPIREALESAGPSARAAWRRAEQAWWRLVMLTEPIARAEARRHAAGLLTTGLDIDDLRSAAVCGLYRAAQGWNPAAGSGWPTYATAGAVFHIQSTLRRCRHLSTTAQDRNLDLRKTLADMERRGEVPYVPHAAEWLGLDPQSARLILESGNGPLRLDGRAVDDANALAGDFLVDDETPDPTDAIDTTERAAIVRRCLAELAPRDRQILELRANGATLQEIGDLLGLSGERIRQLDRIARDRLRPLLEEALQCRTS